MQKNKPEYVPDEAWKYFKLRESIMSLKVKGKLISKREDRIKLKKIQQIIVGEESNQIWEKIPPNVNPQQFVESVLASDIPHKNVIEKITQENSRRLEALKKLQSIDKILGNLYENTAYNPNLEKFFEHSSFANQLNSLIEVLNNTKSTPNTASQVGTEKFLYQSAEDFAYSSRKSKSNPCATFIRVLAWNLGVIGFKRDANFDNVISIISDALFPEQSKKAPCDKKKIDNALALHSRRENPTNEGI